MTDRVCYIYTKGFLQYLTSVNDIKPGCQIALAGDLRPSTDRIMQAVARAVTDEGYQLLNCGKIPSPAVALWGIEQAIPSIMITGSHIPEDRNGIKFNKSSGEILKPDEEGIKNQLVSFDPLLFDSAGNLKNSMILPKEDKSAYNAYVARYTNFFGHDALAGLKLGLYQHSAVGRDLLNELYSALGAEITPLGRSETFIPVDTEAIRPEDIELARQWIEKYKFDAIISTDGDSDRPLICDEKGNWLRGDVAGIICAKFLQADSVSTPVSCNSAVEKSNWFKSVKRTKIGSPYVIAAMDEAVKDGFKNVVGYEANGGFLTNSKLTAGEKTLNPLPTRDAVILQLGILLMAKEQNRTISDLVEGLPKRYTFSDRLKEFPQQKSKNILNKFNTSSDSGDKEAAESIFGHLCGKVVKLDKTDGIRIFFENSDIIHLRPSGNAPEFRCYTESATNENAVLLNHKCMDILKSM
jgi:phosphomannomutase